MNITQANILPTLVANASSVKEALSQVQEQISSGLVSTTYSGLGNGARTVLDLSPQVVHQTTWAKNIDLANGRLAVTQDALTGISDIASKFYASVNSLDTGSPTSVATLQISAKAALQQVAEFLNSKSGETYVFSGTDTGNAPVTTTDPATLTTDLLASDTAQAPFSTTIGSSVPKIEVGAGSYASIGVIANTNVYATSTAPTTGSYARDILRSLASLTTLTSANASSIVSDARSRLSSAVSAISTEQGVVGNVQSTLTQKQTRLSALTATLQTQISSVQDVDAAAAITKASILQVQLQASYSILASTKSLSLANYL